MPAKGGVWEKVCNNSRDRLAQDGDLVWFPFHPRVLKIGAGRKDKKGSFLGVYTQKAPPDWIALSGGLCILGDDKDSKSHRWALRNIKPHQARALDAHESQGGVSVILLRMADKSRWCIPWRLLRPCMTEKNSVSIEELIELGAIRWQIKCADEPPYDWLTPLLSWLKPEENQDGRVRPTVDVGGLRKHGTVRCLSGMEQSESIQNRSGEGDLLPRAVGSIPF